MIERYNLLADQMETHNNPELVKVFAIWHTPRYPWQEIRRLAGDFDVVTHARQIAKFERSESPEEAELSSAHYMMTPWHALQLSLDGEKRALAYFTSIVETAKDPKVKAMAAELVEEEAEHVSRASALRGIRHRAIPGPTIVRYPGMGQTAFKVRLSRLCIRDILGCLQQAVRALSRAP
jgi:hypothetical protein